MQLPLPFLGTGYHLAHIATFWRGKRKANMGMERCVKEILRRVDGHYTSSFC